MQYKSLRASIFNIALGCFAVLAVVALTKFPSAARANLDPIPQQQVLRLETRINQLEQRLYSIETSMRTLEQQSRLAGVTSRDAGQQDVILLRAEVQRLQQRLGESECALAKLDERTLSPAVREARRKSGVRPDGCRTNVDAPIRFSELR
ncbi:MAG TPA: hypothetical protein VGW58_09980 [Pyrinomonadaceae bacterium]|nr:hypothetical protein [Pyrinomonadaceae bacterium]